MMYDRNSMKGYAKLASPLFEISKKDVPFQWNTKCQQDLKS